MMICAGAWPPAPPHARNPRHRPPKPRKNASGRPPADSKTKKKVTTSVNVQTSLTVESNPDPAPSMRTQNFWKEIAAKYMVLN